MNEAYIIAMWCHSASLEIFSQRIFTDYLEATIESFVYKKDLNISMDVLLFCSFWGDVYRPPIYLCNT